MKRKLCNVIYIFSLILRFIPHLCKNQPLSHWRCGCTLCIHHKVVLSFLRVKGIANKYRVCVCNLNKLRSLTSLLKNLTKSLTKVKSCDISIIYDNNVMPRRNIKQTRCLWLAKYPGSEIPGSVTVRCFVLNTYYLKILHSCKCIIIRSLFSYLYNL